MPRATAIPEGAEAAIAPLRADPAAAAVLLDLDGTLAPIAARPEDAVVPERTREALSVIAARYGLTAIVTGRRAAIAREIVGLGELTYAGNHGYEIRRAGEGEDHAAPGMDGLDGGVADFVASLDDERIAAAGIRVEEKGPIFALHWRGAADEPAAEAEIEAIAAAAQRRGLALHPGRKILELRPPVDVDKGTAVESLVTESGVRSAIYVGDDRTDLDAFAGLSRLVEAGRLEAAVRVGVRSDEGPAEIIEQADLILEGQESLPGLLEALAR